MSESNNIFMDKVDDRESKQVLSINLVNFNQLCCLLLSTYAGYEFRIKRWREKKDEDAEREKKMGRESKSTS